MLTKRANQKDQLPVEVSILPRYRRWAHKVAENRVQSFEEKGWDRNKWGRNPLDQHRIGVLGELAFGTYYGLQIDSETYPCSDGGYDFQILLRGEECLIDVKSTTYEPKYLEVVKGKTTADLYVLCWVTPETNYLIGMATREALLERKCIQSIRYGHYNHRITVKYLKPLPTRNQVSPLRRH